MTYAGLLEGTPDAKSNDNRIAYALREAERYCVSGTKPHLLAPPRRDFLRERGDMRSVVDRWPSRVPEWLPMVCCIGSFSDVMTRDPNRDLSVLVVVWFQDEYAMPIQEPASSQLAALDWGSLATDIDI